MPPIDIFLVEDNEEHIVMMRESFAGEPRARVVAVARDGEEALAHLREARELPSVVLLDINMPRMDGFEVLEELKADPRLRHIPVVMLTTSRCDEDVVRSYQSGAAAFITKPVDFDGLEAMVRDFTAYWSSLVTLP
jgi:CheY-like chemotaxis protein